MEYTRPAMKGKYSPSIEAATKHLTIFQFLQHLHWEMEDMPHYILFAFCEQMHPRTVQHFLSNNHNKTHYEHS
jgi:hypothetical protein